MEGLIGLLILIADIYVIIKIVQSSADTVKKVIWVLIVFLLPLIGLVAWYFAGPGGKSG
ncbi:MAG: PLD nuclease N-terminal domain-containing protein [Gammaproteobacteria bacterium]|nr:PLD nuclease N-terminal domain-containing protein [Gammaproteobacteria bacterium]MDH3768139.1 PLD nuclease N-terminal domain-containing protein [Gammaproteobacteria bacterium]